MVNFKLGNEMIITGVYRPEEQRAVISLQVPSVKLECKKKAFFIMAVKLFISLISELNKDFSAI